MQATYLARGGFVLEPIDYSKRQVHIGSERVMDQIVLKHISFSVPVLAGALEKLEEFGGAVVGGKVTEAMAMIRDPDGQLPELLSEGWRSALPTPPGDDGLRRLPRHLPVGRCPSPKQNKTQCRCV